MGFTGNTHLDGLFDLGIVRSSDRTKCHIDRDIQDIYLFDNNEGKSVDRTKQFSTWLPKIAEAGLSGDHRKLELVVVRAVRALKKELPEVSSALGTILAEQSANPTALRWGAATPPPVDSDEGLALVQIESTDDAPRPMLSEVVSTRIEQFLLERKGSGRLLAEGFAPPGTVLLTGAPGTGKTMLSRWIARQLELPFITLDLATSISSYLGKTGFNLRRILDYARSQPCVLLLDEFDAIAKRRNDETEVGELKRIVNVLLKELEDWPLHSVLIAATNHPELLDRAIARRFDTVIEIPLPGMAERYDILKWAGGRFSDEVPDSLLRAIASALEDRSGSDVRALMLAAVRRHLSSEEDFARCLIELFQIDVANKIQGRSLGKVLRDIQASSDRSFKVRELADLFGRVPSTIQHHLKKGAKHG